MTEPSPWEQLVCSTQPVTALLNENGVKNMAESFARRAAALGFELVRKGDEGMTKPELSPWEQHLRDEYPEFSDEEIWQAAVWQKKRADRLGFELVRKKGDA